MAIEFVRDNISAFGGDPENITIQGESAGGGSVSAQLIHDAFRVNGLVSNGHKWNNMDQEKPIAKRFIAQSGTMGMGFLINQAKVENLLMNIVECLNTNEHFQKYNYTGVLKRELLFEVLENMPAEDLLLLQQITEPLGQWLPTFTGDFFPSHDYLFRNELPIIGSSLKPIEMIKFDGYRADFTVLNGEGSLMAALPIMMGIEGSKDVSASINLYLWRKKLLSNWDKIIKNGYRGRSIRH